MNPAEPAAAPRLAFLLDPRALAVVLLVYGIARAAVLSITHDEALTYLFHVRAPWTEVLAHTAPLPSNNHLLNTVAVKALLAVLPPTELVLRLPALLGLALFLWAAARLVSRFATGARAPVGFLLLAGNPFVLDLLVLSRGYALALGLALSAVAIEVGDRTGSEARRHLLAALCATAAVLANLSFAYVLVAIAKKRWCLEHSLYQILQILSVTLFEKTPVWRAFQVRDSESDSVDIHNQLNLFAL